jgi:hypothetical protein
VSDQLGAADTPQSVPVGRSRHGELTLDQIAELQPGLGRLMPDVSERYWILYYAARGGNWGLARYCVQQIRALFRVGATTRPQMRRYLEAFDQGHLGAIDEAIAKQDFAAFEVAYRKGIDGANAFHAATNHPEIVWQLPPNPPQHLYLGPVDERGKPRPPLV